MSMRTMSVPAVLESVGCKQCEEDDVDGADLQLVGFSELAPQYFHLGS